MCKVEEGCMEKERHVMCVKYVHIIDAVLDEQKAHQYGRNVDVYVSEYGLFFYSLLESFYSDFHS